MNSDESGGDRGPADQEPTETYRPALYTLTLDVRTMREELLTGFPTRAEVLRWEQRLAVRTLGEVPMHFYTEIARQFRFSQAPDAEREPALSFDVGSDVDDEEPAQRPRERRQGVLLAALLQGSARDRALDEAGVTELRERLVATHVNPAYHRAFRQLRKSAGEYIKETDESAAHDPERQQHIAMRPALDELDQFQAKALGEVLRGLDDRGAILDWIEDVELATHGEVPDGFAERCYKEQSTVELLTGDEAALQPGRELWAAHHLIPAFNRGVRDLVGRAGELPEVDRERTKPKQV